MKVLPVLVAAAVSSVALPIMANATTLAGADNGRRAKHHATARHHHHMMMKRHMTRSHRMQMDHDSRM